MKTLSCPECTTPLPIGGDGCEICDWTPHPHPSLSVALPTFMQMTGGTMQMGSPTTEIGRDPDETEHPVTVQPFWIATTEVTQALYTAIMRKNPSRDKHPQKPVESLTWFEAIQFCNALSVVYNRQPVYTITLDQVTANMTHNGYRLPTESEWEWMARHHQQQTQSSNWGTQPIADRQELQWVFGNVWELCWDIYAPYLPTDALSTAVPTDARVVRGGSWLDQPDIFRPANRAFVDPTVRTDTIGFRLAHSVLLKK